MRVFLSAIVALSAIGNTSGHPFVTDDCDDSNFLRQFMSEMLSKLQGDSGGQIPRFFYLDLRSPPAGGPLQ